MKMKHGCVEKTYYRHLAKARAYAKGLEGYDRALKICEYFEGCGHPHPQFTFKEVRMNNCEGQTDRQFAISLLKNMAYQTAVNDMLMSEHSKNDT